MRFIKRKIRKTVFAIAAFLIVMSFGINKLLSIIDGGLDTPKLPESVESGYIIESIVDGDTLVINGEKYRLIGVNTPESVHADSSKNNEYGKMASDYTKSLISVGDEVYIEWDKDDTDPYDRKLAYIWLSEDTSDINNMLNYVLVRDGYAFSVAYKPNVKYKDVFDDLEAEAKASNTGLWQYEGFEELEE